MNDKFDELARNMAQSVTRRRALKKFGLGLAGIALALPSVATWESDIAACRDLATRTTGKMLGNVFAFTAVFR